MTLTLEIDKELEDFIKSEAANQHVEITQYLIQLAKQQKEKTDFRGEIVQSIQELSLLQQGKIRARPINQLFNASH